MTSTEISFESLIGQKVGFCGVDNCTFCIVTEDGQRLAYEAVEDENDGYRSMLEELKSVPLDGLILFRSPVATLTIERATGEDSPYSDGHDFSGYRLVDNHNHRWLLVGTDKSDDRYPSFTFSYDPPKDVCVAHEDCRGHAELSRTCAADRISAEKPR